MNEMENEKLIKADRMRYTKNTVSSRLCYLAILADVFYFVSIYKSDVGSWYYQWIIGVSVVYNLLFMLVTFLASEGVKNYLKQYTPVLYLLGLLQFCRIPFLPLRATRAVVKVSSQEVAVMGQRQFLFVIICLAVSGIALIAAGTVNMHKSKMLNAHLKNQEGRT